MSMRFLIKQFLLAGVCAGGLWLAATAAPASDSDTLFKALNDELQRSMTLRLEDLDSPYFIQYSVDEIGRASCRERV